MKTKGIVLCTFLNTEVAFDNASHRELRDALIRKGVINTLVFWMGRMLESRQIEVLTGTNSIVINTSQDCPQNKVLSSLM